MKYVLKSRLALAAPRFRRDFYVCCNQSRHYKFYSLDWNEIGPAGKYALGRNSVTVLIFVIPVAHCSLPLLMPDSSQSDS